MRSTHPHPLIALVVLTTLAALSTLTPLPVHAADRPTGSSEQPTRAEPPASASLQQVIDRAVGNAVTRYAADHLRADQLAITVVDLNTPAPAIAHHRGDTPIYPASVVKLFYLAATHAWLNRGALQDTPELRRALRDMIVDSSNDATSYIVDLLTGTTSGPELPDDELARWSERRNAVNRHFADLGYTGINANRKPWNEGPYGREVQAADRFPPRRNQLTTSATAKLLVEIATARCVSAVRSAEMMQLLARDPAKPDEQALFIHSALPAGSKQWTKSGWTSQTRHVASYIELPGNRRYVVVIFTIDHGSNKQLVAAIAKSLIEQLSPSP